MGSNWAGDGLGDSCIVGRGFVPRGRRSAQVRRGLTGRCCFKGGQIVECVWADSGMEGREYVCVSWGWLGGRDAVT